MNAFNRHGFFFLSLTFRIDIKVEVMNEFWIEFRFVRNVEFENEFNVHANVTSTFEIKIVESIDKTLLFEIVFIAKAAVA